MAGRLIRAQRTRNRARQKGLIASLGASACVLLCATASAQAPQLTVSQFHHTAWTVRDGAPQTIDALAQTRDGFLWLGSQQGLFRFDGVTFERVDAVQGRPLRSANISALHAEPDGALWVGYRFGGASVIRGGSITTYTESDGLPPGTVYGFARDSAGVAWAITTNGLASLNSGRWKRTGAESGLLGSYGTALMVDRRGGLWASFQEGTFRRERGAARFDRVGSMPVTVGLGPMREAPDGSVYVAEWEGPVFRLVASSGGLAAQRAGFGPDSTGAILIDRDGAMWASSRQGVERLPFVRRRAAAPFSRDRIGRAQGLSGFAVTFLEDREGNVWVGTTRGLDRFRRTKFTEAAFPGKEDPIVVVPGDHGALVIASALWPAVRLRGDRVEQLPDAPRDITAASRDDHGVVWLAGGGNLWRLDGDRSVQIATPPEISGRDVMAVTRDYAGDVWLSVVRMGLFRLRKGVWSKADTAIGLPRGASISMLADSQAGGRIWFTYPANRLAVLETDSVRTFGETDGLEAGNVLTAYVRRDRVWIGGERGLALLQRGRIRTFSGAGGFSFRGTSGIVETTEGELWLNGAQGVTRIAAEELAHALSDTAYRPRFEMMDHRDGLYGTAPQFRPLPSLVQGSDGRLWFVTETSVASIHPGSIARNTLPPPVVVRALRAADSTYETTREVTLPKGGNDVEIDYTALSLSIPDRVQFRYRLVGSDTAWHDAGQRRTAYFTRLGPGSYRFQVAAANEDGVWNETGATLAFTIPPTFVQTRVFIALCILAGFAMLWMVNQYRLRRVASRMRERFAATLAERTRIAQELHDTVLQGFTGITLQLQGVRRALPGQPQVAADSLSRVLDVADQTLREARHMVWEMYAPELEGNDLGEALIQAVRAATVGTEIIVRCSVHGDRRRLPLSVETAALRIGREAVVNAVKHSRCRSIDIDVTYRARSVHLTVRDDGRGLVQSEAHEASRTEHWGLNGMRGRAARLGGRVDVVAAREAGTIVTMELPIEASPSAVHGSGPRDPG